MSAADPVPGAVAIECDAGDAATEIILIDAAFNVVKRGVGRLNVSVAPGVYRCKFKAGDWVEDVDAAVRDLPAAPAPPFTIRPAGRKTGEMAAVAFPSAAPIAGTATTHEYHQDHAEFVSRSPGEVRGHGSSLLVMARDYRPPATQPHMACEAEYPDSESPAKHLMLLNAAGEVVADLSLIADVRIAPGSDASAGAKLTLDPGVYRLRVDMGDMGQLEQTLVTCPGWQTQIFLLRRKFRTGDQTLWRPDLARGAVLMARQERGFERYFTSVRLTEIARQALADGSRTIPRSIVGAQARQPVPTALLPDASLQEMLYGKYENPMLGILGAHLLTREEDPDINLVRTVVTNLETLIGPNHPDVRALHLWLEIQDGGDGREAREGISDTTDVVVPPMLYSSWEIILRCSLRRAGIVPRDSLAAHAAQNLWGSGAWLMWRAPKRRSVEATRSARGSVENVGVAGGIVRLVDELVRGNPIQLLAIEIANKAGLGRPEFAVLHQAVGELYEAVFAPSLKAPDAGYRVLNALVGMLLEHKLVVRSDGWHLSLPLAGAGPVVIDSSRVVSTTRLPRAAADAALARLLAVVEDVIPRRRSPAPSGDAGFEPIFDGTAQSLLDWEMAGEGGFALADGAIVAQPGDDFGVLVYRRRRFEDFRLRLSFRVTASHDQSGVFVRSRDPLKRVPDRHMGSRRYEKPQWVPVRTGFQVQIDDMAHGVPGGVQSHRTGAIYDQRQIYVPPALLVPGQWNQLEIGVQGQVYTVALNGTLTSVFSNDDERRGLPPAVDPDSGYVGVQCFRGDVAFKDIRVADV